MQDAPKAVWSILYVSVGFFPSLKQNFIAYLSSKVSDCIFEIHQLWQSDFSRVYSNYCCSCSFEPEIIKISQSSHKMYSNNREFSRVYDDLKCPYEKSLETYRMHLVYIYTHMTEQKQDDQLEHTYSSYMRIRDVALKTCQRRWTIGRSVERGSGLSVLAAQHDDDDDIYIHIYEYIYNSLLHL